jgi:hypothetical protein
MKSSLRSDRGARPVWSIRASSTNEGRWARKDRAGQLGRDGGWRSRDSYVSRHERESLPVPSAVYVFCRRRLGRTNRIASARSCKSTRQRRHAVSARAGKPARSKPKPQRQRPQEPHDIVDRGMWLLEVPRWVRCKILRCHLVTTSGNGCPDDIASTQPRPAAGRLTRLHRSVCGESRQRAAAYGRRHERACDP